MDNTLSQLIADLREDDVLQAVDERLAAGVEPHDVLDACQQGMVLVGNRFGAGEYFISDLMMSAEIFKEVTERLGLGCDTLRGEPVARVVFGTVQGDIHDIGKDLVVGMLRAAGFQVTDLGVDVPPARVVAALEETGATILGLSGLLTVAFDSMKSTVAAVEQAGLRDRVKIMVGGAPVDESVSRYAGADVAGGDAQNAVEVCRRWAGER